jgi:RNA polymerase sigma-70 factor (ECF subfamily)
MLAHMPFCCVLAFPAMYYVKGLVSRKGTYVSYIGREQLYAGAETSLYHQYAARLFAYIYRHLPSQQDAEDILLETFIAALKQNNLPGFASERQMAWVQQVAHNKIVDWYRREKRVTLLPLEQAIEVIDQAPTPEQYAEQREIHERLYHALGLLSELEQQVVRLRFGHGLRFAIIAEVINHTEGSSRALLSRALRHLRAVYDQSEKG